MDNPRAAAALIRQLGAAFAAAADAAVAIGASAGRALRAQVEVHAPADLLEAQRPTPPRSPTGALRDYGRAGAPGDGDAGSSLVRMASVALAARRAAISLTFARARAVRVALIAELVKAGVAREAELRGRISASGRGLEDGCGYEVVLRLLPDGAPLGDGGADGGEGGGAEGGGADGDVLGFDEWWADVDFATAVDDAALAAASGGWPTGGEHAGVRVPGSGGGDGGLGAHAGGGDDDGSDSETGTDYEDDGNASDQDGASESDGARLVHAPIGGGVSGRADDADSGVEDTACELCLTLTAITEWAGSVHARSRSASPAAKRPHRAGADDDGADGGGPGEARWRASPGAARTGAMRGGSDDEDLLGTAVIDLTEVLRLGRDVPHALALAPTQQPQLPRQVPAGARAPRRSGQAAAMAAADGARLARERRSSATAMGVSGADAEAAARADVCALDAQAAPANAAGGARTAGAAGVALASEQATASGMGGLLPLCTPLPSALALDRLLRPHARAWLPSAPPLARGGSGGWEGGGVFGPLAGSVECSASALSAAPRVPVPPDRPRSAGARLSLIHI